MRSLVHQVSSTVTMVILCSAVYAQSHKIDSLNHVLIGSNPKDSIHTCHELTYEWVDVDNRKALFYAIQSYKTAGRIGDSLLLSKSVSYAGQLYRRMEKTDTAIQIYESIIPYMKRNKIYDQLMHIYSSMGGIHLFAGKYDQALRYYDLALQSPVIDEFSNVRRTIMFNTGLLYYKLYDPDRALEYNFKTLAMLKESDPKKEIPQMLVNISLCYLMKKDLLTAENYLEQAGKECGSHCSRYIQMQMIFTDGMIWLEKENLTKAESLFKEAYATANALKDGRFQLDIIERLCEVYNRQKRFSEAKQILAIADSIIPLVEYGLEKELIYKQNIKLYSATHDYERLSQYQQKFIELQDSSFGRTLATRLMKVEAEYQQREASAKMAAQAEVIALNDSLLKWHQVVIALALLTMALLVTLLIISIRGSRRRKNANLILEEKVKERTQDFSIALSDLRHVLGMRDEKAKKVLTEASHSMRAIEALCSLGRDDSDNCGRYLEDIRKLSLKVIRDVEVFQRDSMKEEKVQI